ncbi:MAG: AgmX/PglI C-terminal domain-containing protein [Pseudomonadota bacterium]
MAMGTIDSSDRKTEDSSVRTGGAGKQNSKREEASGLHEIRSLARTTMERLAVKEEDQDSDGALLEASSPAMLGGVLLPEPGRETAAPAEDAGGKAVHKAASARGPWLGLSLLAAIVVVGVVLYMGDNRAGDSPPSVAAGVQRAAAPASAVGASASVNESQPALPGTGSAAPATATAEPGQGTEQPASSAGESAAKALDTAVAKTPEGDRPPGEAEVRHEATRPEKTTLEKAASGTTTAEETRVGASTVKSTAVSAGSAVVPGQQAATASESKTVATTDTPTNGPAKDTPKAARPLDDILNEAVGGGIKPSEGGAGATAGGAQLAASLSREDIRKGMATIRARVEACYAKYRVGGTVNIRVRIEPNGEVSSVEVVDEKFSGTETGHCVAAAVQSAHFPKFNGPPMTIGRYPFRLQ